ncbi:GMP/IMP nucleotidase [Arenicella xantha]|uniref:Putative hydrolase of the HAD superfamily n=1 Tax=Arenicella xantha TaxID=644221 RepID=A0A395JPN9_9GAMM|nr:GMP/IMP nucleotidase [Arenicella xantha]RBP53611.1 putative hydrolase of the HAD superfamily [Arenicella xantha]
MQIDWQNIDTVLLDMDGTLLDLHYDNHFWQEHLPVVWGARHGLPAEAAKERLMPLFRKHMGTLNWYCVDFWSDTLDIDIMQHKTETAHKIAYRPNAQAFLQRCQTESEDVRLITNAHRKVLDLKIQHTQIDQYFDQMHCSHELDYPKEDRGFWDSLQKLKAFDPSRTLFLDDSESVLEAADDYGIAHVFSIAKPDSQAQRASGSRFHMLDELV